MRPSNQEPLEVLRIIRRSTQGVNLPFFCAASDGREYWVKGAGLGSRALCCEWIAGTLAQRLGLPVPPFVLLAVSQEAIDGSLISDVHQLGAGIAFGSENVEGVQELGIMDVKYAIRHELDVARMTLLFDWWVKNGDRTLGEKGGNPNLLVETGVQSIRVIDHNLAFDRDWDGEAFFSDHVFGQLKGRIDAEWMLAARSKMCETLDGLDEIWGQLPEQWLFLDRAMSVPTDFSVQEVKQVLQRVQTEWKEQWT